MLEVKIIVNCVAKKKFKTSVVVPGNSYFMGENLCYAFEYTFLTLSLGKKQLFQIALTTT
jgi:hypothetical protein